MEVGIDGIEVWSGKLKLDLPGTLAPERGEDPEKYTKGLGVKESSLPDAHEDIVTMGANAALRLMKRKDLEPEDISRIDVATETSFDNSKPVSTYITGCLEKVYGRGRFKNANQGERKFACISATQAIEDACNWIRAGVNNGKKALVISSDVALYERGDPGEPTQGAGAVALLISKDPNVVEIEKEQGYGAADETDFLKPYSYFPSVDGKRSIEVYLDRMREALEDYERKAGRVTKDGFARATFHTPFPKMSRKAAVLGFRHTIKDTEIEEELAGQIGKIPREDDYENYKQFEEELEEYTNNLGETEIFRDWYEQVVEPTIQLAALTGNWYTGSVHIARVSALLEAQKNGKEMEDKSLLVGSYGSGAQAEIHSERICKKWKNEMEELNIEEMLDNRYDLDFDEYKEVRKVHNYSEEADVESLTEPNDEFVFAGHGSMGERVYEFA